MYLFKENLNIEFNQREIARVTGLAFETVNRIVKRKQECSKVAAYCITKAINDRAEILDYFELVKKGE